MIHKKSKQKGKKLLRNISLLTVFTGSVFNISEIAAADTAETTVVATPLAEPASDVYDSTHPMWNSDSSGFGQMQIKEGIITFPNGGEPNRSGLWNLSMSHMDVGRIIDYMFEDGTTAAESFNDFRDVGGYISWNYSIVTHQGRVTGAGHYGTAPFELEAVASPEIEGYTPDIQIVPETSWSLSEGLEHITVTYKKNEVAQAPTEETPAEEIPSDPEEEASAAIEESSPTADQGVLSKIPSEPIVTVTPAAVSPAETEIAATNLTRTLPATGEENHGTAILAGSLAILTAGTLGLAARLRKKR